MDLLAIWPAWLVLAALAVMILAGSPVDDLS